MIFNCVSYVLTVDGNCLPIITRDQYNFFNLDLTDELGLHFISEGLFHILILNQRHEKNNPQITCFVFTRVHFVCIEPFTTTKRSAKCSKYYMRLCHASEQCVFVMLVLIIMLIGSKCYVTCVICLTICERC